MGASIDGLRDFLAAAAAARGCGDGEGCGPWSSSMGKSPCCVLHSLGKLELPASWPIPARGFLAKNAIRSSPISAISAPILAPVAGPSRRHSPPPACHHTAITSLLRTFLVAHEPSRRDDGAVWGTGYTFVPFLSVLYHRRCGRLRPTPTEGKATHGAGLCMQEIAGLLIFPKHPNRIGRPFASLPREGGAGGRLGKCPA